MNELNEKIAGWAGLECRCETEVCWSTNKPTRYWGNCPRHSNGGNPPDYSRDDVAIGLLPILSKKTSKMYVIASYPNGKASCYDLFNKTEPYTVSDNIASAICAAVEKLMEE